MLGLPVITLDWVEVLAFESAMSRIIGGFGHAEPETLTQIPLLPQILRALQFDTEDL